MLTSEEIFITDHTELFLDLYRFGNSRSPRFDHIRPNKDAKIQDRAGIKYIIADGNGISAFSSVPQGKRELGKYARERHYPLV